MTLFQFFKNLRIRAKLLLAFGSLLAISVFLILFTFQTLNKIQADKRLTEKTDSLFISMQALEISIAEFVSEEYKSTRFLMERKSHAQEVFQTNFGLANNLLDQIEHSLPLKEQTLKVAEIRTGLKNVSKVFAILTEELIRRGFKDYGLEGALRKSIHDVENVDFKYDKADLLTLRRHEKDFFLRKDTKYQIEFNKSLIAFREKLAKSADASVLDLITHYHDQFNEIVDIETRIGLSADAGMRGELRSSIGHVKPLINQLNLVVDTQSKNATRQSILLLITIVVIQLISGIALAIYYSNQISKPVKQIKSAVQSLASGNYPGQLVVDSTEEMGQTKAGFNQFVKRLQVATNFAETMGNGNLQLTYEEQFSNDVLAKALINMQAKLKEADEQKAKINWVNKGAARFNDILKEDNASIEKLGDSILKFLVNYVEANQAALFIRESKERDLLIRIASYAYGKKKFIDQEIEVGQGMIGQAVLEGETIYLTDVPSDYVSITSGLGEGTPKAVLIVPLKVRDQIMGILEIATFSVFEKYKIEFIEQISENIATMLSSRKSIELTNQLLAEAREKTEMLTQQEEEMRQSSEELLATQEEMTRQRHELEAELMELRQQMNAQEK
jgi:nitrogen fixation/metabolism regulation signal transduction histidine kinase